MVYVMPDPVDPDVLDRFTKLAARVLDVPVVCVSLLDDRGRRVVSSHDLTVRSGPEGGMVRRPDGNEALAVHAAIPLLASDGRQVGTLTVMDRRPVYWSAVQLEFLKELSLRIVGKVDIGPTERMM